MKPILTIKRFLDEKGALAMLKDPLLLQVSFLSLAATIFLAFCLYYLKMLALNMWK